VTAGRDKGSLRIEDAVDVAHTLRCIPEVLAFPTVVSTEKSRLRPIDPGEALLELVPNVLLTEASSARADLALLGVWPRTRGPSASKPATTSDTSPPCWPSW